MSINSIHLGDNCIQNFHLGSYVVGYMVGNFVLWRCVSRAVKQDFRQTVSDSRYDDVPPQLSISNMVIPILMLF